MRNILINHYQNYQKMEVSDFLKLLYQSSFGPRHLHLIPNVETIHRYLDEEIKSMTHKTSSYEENIGNGYVRVYLSSIKKGLITQSQLERAFLSSMNDEKNMESASKTFYGGIKVFMDLCKKDIIQIPLSQVTTEIDKYLIKGVRPIHHSEIYRKTYNPHYRVVAKKHLEMKIIEEYAI